MRITFTGDNFDEMHEFIGPDEHLVYNALDELRIITRIGEHLSPPLRPGDELDRTDGVYTKIEK